MEFAYNILSGDVSLNVEQDCIRNSISKKLAYTIISRKRVDYMYCIKNTAENIFTQIYWNLRYKLYSYKLSISKLIVFEKYNLIQLTRLNHLLENEHWQIISIFFSSIKQKNNPKTRKSNIMNIYVLLRNYILKYLCSVLN